MGPEGIEPSQADGGEKSAVLPTVPKIAGFSGGSPARPIRPDGLLHLGTALNATLGIVT